MSVGALQNSSVGPSTILVVEDEPVLLHLTAESLRDRGYAVLEACTAVEAAELIRGDSHVMVAFVDVNLPGLMGGLTFAGWMRSQHPDIPIILTSGANTVSPSVKGIVQLAFVSKPYDMDRVTQLIEEALGHR